MIAGTILTLLYCTEIAGELWHRLLCWIEIFVIFLRWQPGDTHQSCRAVLALEKRSVCICYLSGSALFVLLKTDHNHLGWH